MQTTNTQQTAPAAVQIPELSFPKAGGALRGLDGVIPQTDMSGIAQMSLPLPISAARHLTPELTLSYQSSGGNSPFGLGWQLSLNAVRRRTNKGVPAYTDQDTFIGASGEILVSDTSPTKKTREHQGMLYQATRFYCHREARFDFIEHWQAVASPASYWLVKSADGTQHLFGFTEQARICDPEQPASLFTWLLEESLHPYGEHCVYHYKQEDTVGVDLSDVSSEKIHQHTSQRYLKKISYANRQSHSNFYAFENRHLDPTMDWLLALVFDYGEHSNNRDSAVSDETVPSYQEEKPWLKRADSFSEYAAGFKIQTHRLCRQVLMFHHFNELGSAPSLVKSLRLRYRETPVLSLLRSAQSIGYSIQDKKPVIGTLPPVELDYHAFSLKKNLAWQSWAPATAFHHGPYQVVDLYGEGIPGIFYQDGTSHYYRAPCRQTSEQEQNPDALSYEKAWSLLPVLPVGGLSERNQSTLMDITGHSEREWVWTQAGMAGFFSLGDDKQFRNFIPFEAFPSEFLHPQAQLIDAMGAGLLDLILVGPKSVRVYPNRRDKGFAAPFDVLYDLGVLPLAGSSEKESVVFTDLLGSGQAHLVRIQAQQITCWPNLGRGRFAAPILWDTLPFDDSTFDPRRLFFVDLDGSGASDLVYATQRGLQIFCNQSGNGLAEPYLLPFPEGVQYDTLLHQISFADIYGYGYSSILLSQLSPQPRHWIYDFNTGKKPYLLNRLNNNLGLDVQIDYRSSAQEWLDEKQERPNAHSGLPFAMPLVKRIVQHDEITENQLVGVKSYRQGYYDKEEREFNGFGLVISHDSEIFPSKPRTGELADFCAPLCSKTWYYNGAPRSDEATPYYKGDIKAQPLKETLCVDDNGTSIILPLAQQQEQHRVLRGLIRRQEIYGLDESEQAKHPYSVSEFRYITRLIQTHQPYSRWFSSLLEQLDYHYERVADDPRCSQQIGLSWDRYGAVTRSLSIQYPRRHHSPEKYPAEYYDAQQYTLHLHEEEIRLIHLDQSDDQWRLQLPCEQTSWEYAFTQWQALGLSEDHILSYEDLQQTAKREALLKNADEKQLSHWLRYYYQDVQGTPLALGQVTIQALLAYTRQAEIGPQQFAAMQKGFEQENELIREKLKTAKYHFEAEYYWITSEQARYETTEKFYCLKHHTNAWGGCTRYEYDAYTYFLTTLTDAANNQTQAFYDYRHLQIARLIDINDNTSAVAYDALGRIIASTTYGMMFVLEEKVLSNQAVRVGFCEENTDYRQHPLTLEQALSDSKQAVQDWATIHYYDPYSWMKELPDEVVEKHQKSIPVLKTQGYLTTDNKICASLRWLTPEQLQYLEKLLNMSGVLKSLLKESRLQSPVYSASFISDRYPGDPERQVRVNIAYSDGFGRLLAEYQRSEPGLAYQTDENYLLKMVEGKPITEESSTRWRVSEKQEYNNKGLVVRSYLPYFLDTHHYVRPAYDTAYFTQHYYDASGRVVKIVNAKGYFQRNAYFTWHQVNEDENDTWSEVLEAQK